MVHRWLLKGKALGTHQHRCEYWASVIGGILGEAGLGALFLGNLDEAAAEMDEDLSQLAALADHVWRNEREKFTNRLTAMCEEPVAACPAPLPGPKDPDGVEKEAAGLGLPAGEWVPVFEKARLLLEKLSQATLRSKATTVGHFLSKMVDRQILVDAEFEELAFTLRMRKGRSNKKLFFFEVRALKSAPVSDVEEISGKGDPDLGASGLADGPEEQLLGTPAPGGNPPDHELEWY
jgi:hypothetical protein